ncbi:hypothetical protein [Dyadobacter sp. OTU695]|uniref:hypothetical protein n=1 Tax=Dyadobacter sp. OTU695 TaxID=3043860 RepID=UPI00313A7D03
MKLLIMIFGGLVFSIPVLALVCAEAICGYLAANVNWPLVFIVGFSILIVYTFRRMGKDEESKTYKHHG